MLLNSIEVGSLAPIAAVMLLKHLPLCEAAAFERKAGSPFLDYLIVPLLKKIYLFNRLIDKLL